ncbi:hypothetical protein F183_A19760 [Bryobacterales bacterium F-183]|nr:hypothetical protein F183_A19760 [Bryobacterales bacterium F-183]
MSYLNLDGPLRIVAIGGGTGLSTLLRGLKKFAYSKDGSPLVEITAIVTVTDDGGSSGRLREEFSVLPPGDIRNCMVALSEDEALLSRLFQYRFKGGKGLDGHSFGNLFLTALTNLTGDFAQAVKFSGDVLAITGNIYPSTARNVSLEAELENGRMVSGETRISKSKIRIKRISLNPKNCKPLPETLDAIAKADLITMGPGSLFTSVIPNLLVKGIPEAIAKSRAVKAYFVNLMWQPGETTGFKASDHVEAIYAHSRPKLLDHVVVNTEKLPKAMLKRYEAEGSFAVETDVERMEDMGIQVVGAPLVDRGKKIRHDSDNAAMIAVRLAERSRRLAAWKRSQKGKEKA